MTKVDTSYPLSLIINCEKTGQSNPEDYISSGYEVFYKKSCQINGHNLIDKSGNCLNCNSHLLKSLERKLSQEFIFVVVSEDGLYTSIVSSTDEKSAIDRLKASKITNSIEWTNALETSVSSISFDLASEALKKMEAPYVVSIWGRDFEVPNIYICPKELILFTVKSLDESSVEKMATSMFSEISRESHSIENALSSEEKAFIESHDISVNELLDAKGMKTHEYKAALSKSGKLLAINAYPCNAHGHKIRNINNTCVICHPEKIRSEKYVTKTPELKFIEKNKIPSSLVLDLKLEKNKDFKSALSADSIKTIAIHTYRCKKCGLGVRNANGSCLNCKTKKLEEALHEKNN